MNKPRLTEAQLKALLWLYDGCFTQRYEGGWCKKAGRLHSALSSLSICHPTMAECRKGNLGKRGGYEIHWRLAPAGEDFLRTYYKQFTGEASHE